MNRTRILVGLATCLGLGVAVACGSSSSSNNNGNASGNDSGSTGTSSGSSSGSGGSSGGSSGGTGCAADEVLCLGFLGNTCLSSGQTCVGTMVLANECSATNACPSGQVCCSSFVSADGGQIVVTDAAVAVDAATTTSLGALGSVAVQCMTQCPSNALSSQVCVLESDGGSPTACPEGTTCQDYLPVAISTTIPNTLCLQPRPVYDGGYAPPVADGSVVTGSTDAASTTAADATAD